MRDRSNDLPHAEPRDIRHEPDALDASDAKVDQCRRLQLRILVVDDNDGFREAFADHLRDTYQAFVETAPDAKIALRMLTEREAFDLVLLDVEMPHEDGIAATRKMRQAGVLGQIVLMSEEAEHGERARALGAAFFEKSDHAELEAILLAGKGDRSHD